MFNTIQSLSRFFSSILRKQIFSITGKGTINDIINVIHYNNNLSSSGQPTKQEFACIQQADYEVVVNLAPYDFIENPLKNEEKIVTGLGLTYYHIPVDFKNPTEKDFKQFCEIFKNEAGKKIWVHCAVNMRGSAFVYKYRTLVAGENKEICVWDLREVWEPFGVWKKFVFGEI